MDKSNHLTEQLNNIPHPPGFVTKNIVGVYTRYPLITGVRRVELGCRLKNQFKSGNAEIPLVTIITVVYNNAKTIRRCIESVLKQDYKNVEYIVIDGGSTDGTVEILFEYKHDLDYILSEKDHGLYDAMNKGISLSQGEYIAFLNSDDYYLSGAIRLSIANILANNLDLSYAGFVYADEKGRAVVADEGRDWDESMFIQGTPCGHETVFANKRCFELIGNYDQSFNLAADYKWLMSAFKAGLKAKRMDRLILVMDTGGTSFNEIDEKEENYRLLKENFGDLNSETLEKLYRLKFYKNWHGQQLPDYEMLDLLAASNTISDIYHRSLYLTIRNRKKGLQGVICPSEPTSPDKLKIAIVLTFLTGISGGAERIAIEAANELVRRGHAVTVISCHGIAGEPYYELDDRTPFIDIAVHPYKQQYESLGKDFALNYEDLKGRKFSDLNYSPSREDFDLWCQTGHLWRCRMYRGFFMRHKFDLVISHMPSTFPYVLLGRKTHDNTLHIAALHNAPKYKFYSDLYPASSEMDRYMRLVSLEKADRIGVLFDAFHKQMPVQYQSKCFTLPNFISTKNSLGSRCAISRKNILTVGRLVSQKGHATLLKSYAKIVKNHPEWTLEIYGEGPLRSQLVDLCKNLGLDHTKIFKGTRKDIHAAYEESSIYAFPSLFEGFGLTLIEAMSYQLPVVGFDDCEGVKYLVNHEKNGLLVTRNNEVDSFANALTRLIESSNLRRILGAQAKITASQYTVGASIDALEKDYNLHANRRKREIAPIDNSRSGISSAIITTYTEGGAGIASKRLQKGLMKLGDDAIVLSLSPSEGSETYQAKLTRRMQVVLASVQVISSEDNRLAGSTIISPSYPGLTKDQLSFLKYVDVINLHWVQRILSNESIAMLANMGKPIVWTMHDMNPLTGGCHYTAGCEEYVANCHNCPQLVDTYDDYTARVLMDKKQYFPKNIVLVSPSRWLAECARKSAVFKHHRIEVIPNSLDTDIYKPIPKRHARAALGLPLEAKILLFTCHSHNERRKGFRELLSAASSLPGDPRSYHIVTFGEESQDIAELDISYTALGYIKDDETLVKGYSAADVTILPTLEDNLPNTILESIACGTPVVAFHSGGVSDAIVEGVTGYLVPRGDCQALADCIVQAVAQDLRDKCRTYALKEFSLEIQASRYQKLYKELLSIPSTADDYVIPEIFPRTAPVLIRLLADNLATAQNRINHLAGHNNHLQKAKKQIDVWLSEMRNSRSWRVTWPLRAIKLFFTNNKLFWYLARQKLLNK